MNKVARPAKRARTPPEPAAAPGPATPEPGRWITEAEWALLHERLDEARSTLAAIQSGEVDAVLVNGAHGSEVYSRTGAEQPFRVYVEQMQEGAITVSQAGLILYCNRRFAEMVKTPLERVIGADIVNHLSRETWAQIARVFTGNCEFVKEERVLSRHDSTQLAVHVTASRMPDLAENIACVVVTDLTEQKNQQELREAKILSDQSNRAKDAFLATLSHELRTPLVPVLLAASALEKSPGLPAHVQRDLAMIRRNVELEARLIDDLLDLTRIANGKLELQLNSLDVHAAIHAVVEICRSDLEAKGHRFELGLAAQHFVLAGDAVRVQQALWNLLRNAIKFTPPMGHIAIETGNPTAGTILVEVKDSGIGFNADEAARLFQPFEQAGRHITRQFGGLGLGLSISASIVRAHHGTIRAQSRGVNLGATFSVELPLRAVPPAALAPSAARPPASQTEPRLRLLLVEDHRDTRATLQRYLQAGRNEVTAAATAEEALQIAAHRTFDLVVSDLGLPDEGGGLALMRQLREKHGLKGIAISGYGMEEDIAQCLAAGFTRHLTKPFSLERLKALIAEVAGAK